VVPRGASGNPPSHFLFRFYGIVSYIVDTYYKRAHHTALSAILLACDVAAVNLEPQFVDAVLVLGSLISFTERNKTARSRVSDP